MNQLVDLFPDWNKHDLKEVLDECNSDLLLAIERISSGQVEQWHSGKTQQKPKKTKDIKSKDNGRPPSGKENNFRRDFKKSDVKPRERKTESAKSAVTTTVTDKPSNPSSTLLQTRSIPNNTTAAPAAFTSASSNTARTTTTITTPSGVKIQKSLNKQSWAQLVKGEEQQKAALAAEKVLPVKKTSETAEKKSANIQITKSNARTVNSASDTFVPAKTANLPDAISSTPKKSEQMMSSLPSSAVPPQPSPSKIMPDLSMEPKVSHNAPPGLKQKPINRQKAAVVMPNTSSAASVGMRFGSLAIGSEQTTVVNGQSLEPTPAASNLTSPSMVPPPQPVQHQQKTPAQASQIQAPAQQNSNMLANVAPVPIQQMHNGFGLGHMGAAEYSALYNSDPQTRAMMGYYDPNMQYNHSIPHRYQEGAAPAANAVPAANTASTAPNGTAAHQQQAAGMQPSQPYPMPYHPAYYPYYFAPNYGSNVYGGPYKNNGTNGYGYPNPAAPVNVNPGQVKGYYEENTLGLDYNKYMQGQNGYNNKPRRFENTNGANVPSSAVSAQSQVGTSMPSTQNAPLNQQSVSMNQKPNGYYAYPQQRATSGNTQYWTQ